MRNTFSTLVVLGIIGLIAAPSAQAQRNEVSLLAGATTPGTQVAVGSFFSVSASASLAAQFSYAYLLRETPTGKLYLELPVTRVAKASVGIDANLVGVAKSQVFFTPGIRYRMAPQARVSPYLASGGGFGWFQSVGVKVDPGFRVNAGTGWKPAVDFGGGLDFRISRSFGLRADVRDFVAAGADIPRRNHLVMSFGFSVRF